MKVDYKVKLENDKLNICCCKLELHTESQKIELMVQTGSEKHLKILEGLDLESIDESDYEDFSNEQNKK